MKKEQYSKARVQWFRDDLSSMDIPSDGVMIHTTIRFEEEEDIIAKWTAEIIIREFINKTDSYVELKYVFEQAPHDLLRIGNKFMICDGPYEIAKGEIIKE